MMEVVRQFSRGLIQHKLEKVNGRFQKKAERVYAASTFDRFEFRFNRNQFEEFLDFAAMSGIQKHNLEITYVPLYAPRAVDVSLAETWKPRENQVGIIDYIVSDGHIKVVTLQTGQGKAHPNTTPIKVPGGWLPMGDVKVGTKVIAYDGSICGVTAVYPQGQIAVETLVFGDGRSIEACAEHLWLIRVDGGAWHVSNTTNIKELVCNGHRVVIPKYLESLEETEGLQVTQVIGCRVTEAQCITIDHPAALYVAGDHIVTHNTSCGLKAGEILGTRLGIVVLGRFFEKWISDVKGQYRLKNDDILAIRGYKQLKEILWCLATEPLEAKVVIITSTTIHDYISHYEGSRFKDQEPWLVPPEKLWERLGVGFRIIDEAHMHFHLNFCIDLYTHIPKGLYLSATLEPDDPFVDKMYRIAYPMATRVNGGAYIKYCDVTAIGYRLAFWQKARTKGYGGSYSHSAFEEWLMKKDKPLRNYLDLIHTVVDTEYLRKREPNQKMLIFAYTVDLCKLIRDDLKRRPDLKGVSIEKYTSEDPYSVIQGNDIVITTLGSAGTAIDIPGLLCCLMTTSISATQANLQALGRLREMHAWPNSKPHFLYLYCLDLVKQVEYHEKKKRIFNGRVLSHREIEAPKVI